MDELPTKKEFRLEVDVGQGVLIVAFGGDQQRPPPFRRITPARTDLTTVARSDVAKRLHAQSCNNVSFRQD
ncbi:MAG: hypothetical protein ACLPW4_13895 [Candidatus Sulfotelmatobacter sp.]